MERLTNEQVSEQQQRFDTLLTKVNLFKLGEKLLHKQVKYGIGSYYNYLHRYLRFNGVQYACIHPVTREFYNRILEVKAINEYLTKIKELSHEKIN